MRELVSQAWAHAGDELPPSGVVRQRAVSPSTGTSTPPRKCGRSHRKKSPSSASPRWGKESDHWDHLERSAHALRQEVDSFNGNNSCSMLACDRLFLGDDAGTVHHRERGHKADRPSEAGSRALSPLAAREAMRSLLTRVSTTLDIKLDDSPSVPISAEFCDALQESWASARGRF